jgi:hypothetical protein
LVSIVSCSACRIGGDVLARRGVDEVLEHLLDHRLGTDRQLDEVGRVGVVGGPDAAALAEDVDVEQRVGAEPVGAVHRDAGDLAGGVQAGYDVGVVAQHLRLDVGGDAAHRVVRGRLDRDRVGVGLDAEVGAHELGDVGQLLVQLLPRQVGQVEYDVVGVRPAAAALADLLPDRAGRPCRAERGP